MKLPFNGWNPFRKRSSQEETAKLPDIPVTAPEANEWGVQLLDVRPVTKGMISMTAELLPAAIALSYKYGDGRDWIKHAPVSSTETATNLQFRVSDHFCDGGLFIPTRMEHKWAIFYHGGKILFVRSWMGRLWLTADVTVVDGIATITRICGTFWDDAEEGDLNERALDALLRCYVLNEEYPVPIPELLMNLPVPAAQMCMKVYGYPASFACSDRFERTMPGATLATYPMLHTLASEGDIEGVRDLLEQGTPVDLPDARNQTALWWGMSTGSIPAVALLLERRANVDYLDSEGSTPLMGAIQLKNIEMSTFLLDHGAGPNVRNHRGFTALHRAAEVGEFALVKLLLDHGADPHVEIEGHSPRSLALGRGHRKIVGLIDESIGEREGK